MLKSFINKNATIECNGCGAEFKVDFKDEVSNVLPEFGEYENKAVACKDCGVVEVFNMNIPTDPDQDDVPVNKLPIEEEVQRYYVRSMIMDIRKDFKEKGNKKGVI